LLCDTCREAQAADFRKVMKDLHDRMVEAAKSGKKFNVKVVKLR
jgi:hypothetical protein